MYLPVFTKRNTRKINTKYWGYLATGDRWEQMEEIENTSPKNIFLQSFDIWQYVNILDSQRETSRKDYKNKAKTN